MGESTNAYINSSTFEGNGTAITNVATANGTLRTSAVTTIANTILDSSTETENCVNLQDEKDGKGLTSFVNGGSNLDSGVSCGFSSNSGSIFGQNPHLGELADYGGPTPTMPLLSGSPAIDKGNPSTCPGRDQRGLAAVVKCDIGAFEYAARPSIFISVGTGKASLPDGTLGVKLTIMLVNQLGNPLVGWGVSFDPSSGGISLSSTSARTDASGMAYIYASASGLSNDATINVSSGAASAFFLASHLGYISAYGSGSGLPNTGFAPGEVTTLPQQPADKAYDQSKDILLEIPSLNLKMPVVGIPQVGNQWDITWLSSQVGYLQGTAFPSWKGNSVLTGHSTLADGTAGPFAKLSALKWGDQIILYVYGVPFVYEVREVKSVGPDDDSVIGHKDEPWITLLTCQDFNPAFHTYLKRLAVSAVLIQQGKGN
jgi:LPXTG-site transpeptidase (sortase) family protein